VGELIHLYHVEFDNKDKREESEKEHLYLGYQRIKQKLRIALHQEYVLVLV